MLQFLLIFLPICLILIISAFLKKLFNYYIEHAMFLTVCSITILLILFGLIGLLPIGFYLILAVVCIV